MPKIYEYFGIVFFFYANDHEPIHVHVQFAEYESKVILYHNHIVTKWLQFYVYKQKVQSEKITKKVKP